MVLLKIMLERLKMKIFKYNSIKELTDSIVSWKPSCLKCKGFNELDEYEAKFIIENYEITFDKIPLLKCALCGEIVIPPYSLARVNHAYLEMIKKKIYKFSCKLSNFHEKNKYCNELSLVYSKHDYECIPGLKSLSDDGFLAPVYFNRKILTILMQFPEYEVDWFSEGYGCVSKKEEWQNIVFGINSNGKLVMWLGDLDSMDITTQKYFEINNVESDHKIIDSDFYRAQILSLWSEGKKDRMVFINRNKFYDNAKIKYSINLYHLEEECNKKKKNFKSPVLYLDSELKESIETMHQYCIEGVSVLELKKLCFKLDSAYTYKDLNGLKSIKLLEIIFKQLYGSLDASSFISPLYSLCR